MDYKEVLARLNDIDKDNNKKKGAVVKASKKYAKKNANKSSNSRQLSKETKTEQDKAINRNTFARGVSGYAEGVFNSTLGMLNAFGKPQQKTYRNKYQKETENSGSYKVGNLLGELVGYSAPYGASAKVLDKGAKAVLSTKAGTKFVGKAVGTKIGTRLGEEATKKVIDSSTKALIGDSTIGTVQNLAMTKNEGYTGKEFGKQFAINQGMDLALGGAIELAPITKAIGNSNVKGLVKHHSNQDELFKLIDEVKSKNNPNGAKEVVEDVAEKKAYAKLPVKNEIENNGIKAKVFTNNLAQNEKFSKGIISQEGTKNSLKTENKASVLEPKMAKNEQLKGLKKKKDELENKLDDLLENPDDNAEELKNVYSQLADTDRAIDEVKKLPAEKTKIDLPKLNKQKDKLDKQLFKLLDNPVENKEKILALNKKIEKNYEAINELKKAQPKNELPQLKATRKTLKKELPITEKVSKSGNTKQPSNLTQEKILDSMDGEKSVKELSKAFGVNEKTYKTKREVKQGAVTKANSPIMTKEGKKKVINDIENGMYDKTVVPNEVAIKKADEFINEVGYEGALDSIYNNVVSGKADQYDNALCLQLVRHYLDEDDIEMATKVVEYSVEIESNAGRTLQSARLFNSLSPEGKTRAVIRMAQKLSKAHGIDLTIDVSDLKRLLNAVDSKEARKIQAEIGKNLWDKIPPTLGEKLSAWRYLSMLGNPRTHIRNIIGNTLSAGANKLSDTMALGLEKAFGKQIAKKGGVKTKAFITHSDKDLLEFADKHFKDDVDLLTNESSKYLPDKSRPLDNDVFSNNNIIGKATNKAVTTNSSLLEREDIKFMGIAYRNAYAQFLKANGLSIADVTAKEVSEDTAKLLKQAKGVAQQRALYATYRDPSFIADTFNRLRRGLEYNSTDDLAVKGGKLIGGLVMDSAVPFVKTPINILKRSIDFSPVGLLGGVNKIVSAKTGEELVNGLERISRGTTGTGLMFLGYYLAKQGLANGSIGQYGAKDTDLKQAEGYQNFALNINGTSISLDWASPLALPFFMGVALNESAPTDGLNVATFLDSTKGMLDPIFEMSMLQGIENIFGSSFSDEHSITQIGVNSAENFISQFVPTLASQFARTLTESRRITLATDENESIRGANKFIDKLTNKMPFLTDYNQEYVDLWGKTDSKYNTLDYLMQGAENFLSPAYISKIDKDNKVNNEITRLADNLDPEKAKEVIPLLQRESVLELAGEKYRMTEEQLTQYKKTRGQESLKGVKKLIATDYYKKLSDKDKAKAIKRVYETAGEKAKKEALMSQGVNATDYDFVGLSKNKQSKYKSSQISKSKYVDYFTSKVDTDGNGSIKQSEAQNALDKMNLTRSEKAYLWSCTNKGWKTNPYK